MKAAAITIALLTLGCVLVGCTKNIREARTPGNADAIAAR